MDGHIVALSILNHSVHRFRILGPEIENLANFNAARNAAAFLRDIIEQRLIMSFIGTCIKRCEFIQHALSIPAFSVENKDAFMLHGLAFFYQVTIKQIKDHIIYQQARANLVREEKERNKKKRRKSKSNNN